MGRLNNLKRQLHKQGFQQSSLQAQLASEQLHPRNLRLTVNNESYKLGLTVNNETYKRPVRIPYNVNGL